MEIETYKGLKRYGDFWIYKLTDEQADKLKDNLHLAWYAGIGNNCHSLAIEPQSKHIRFDAKRYLSGETLDPEPMARACEFIINIISYPRRK